MQVKAILLLVAVVVAIIVAGVWWLLRADPLPPRESNQVPLPGSELDSSEQVPDLELEDFSGNIVRLRDFDTPVVINAWAVWCPFCGKELADFATVQTELGDQVTFIAIDRAESREAAQEFTDSIGVTDKLLFLLDPSDSFYRAMGGFSMPETLFVKADGSIHFHKRGPMTMEEIRQRTQELVQ